MRLFIAINFPNEIKSTIAKISADLKQFAMRGNFSFDENLHLTLVFLGECNFQQMETIKSVMNKTIFSNFMLTFDKVGYFKRDGSAVWWISLIESEPLYNLQADLTNSLSQKGFVLENRQYTPHITFGRQVIMPAKFVRPEIEEVSFKVTSIELMKSERINGKLTYISTFQHISHSL